MRVSGLVPQGAHDVFTGIVQEIGTVVSVTRRALVVNARQSLKYLQVGGSIAVNGVCLTVTSFNDNSFSVDVMLETLKEAWPDNTEWTSPQGGLFLWSTLPDYFNTSELIMEAVEQKVAFVPGAPFYPCGGGQTTMRLNFSYATPDKITEGISRLGRVIQEKIDAYKSA